MEDTSYQRRRRAAIEAAAFELLAEKGYKAASMLEIAKRAGASNETLYKWYGNKQGLFRALVEANAADVAERLDRYLDGSAAGSALAMLDDVGAALLVMLTGDRAVALNRAAAGDVHDTGTLGPALAAGGRDAIRSRLTALFRHARTLGEIHADDAAEAAETWLSLLVGDLQIRRVTGVAAPLDRYEAERRARHASRALGAIYGQSASRT